jgi:hypothetical protein
MKKMNVGKPDGEIKHNLKDFCFVTGNGNAIEAGIIEAEVIWA